MNSSARPTQNKSRQPARQVAAVRILIVEDEKTLRDILIRAVIDWGFCATPAWSGEDAIRFNQASAFDIAVLDLCLPGIDGIETLNRLREHSPHLQGIVLTGSATITAAKRAIHLDVVEFLTKPANRGELEQAIDRARRRLPAVLPTRRLSTTKAILPVDSATLDDVERKHILAALDRNKGDRRATAAELGIARKTLYNRIKRYVAEGLGHPTFLSEPDFESEGE